MNCTEMNLGRDGELAMKSHMMRSELARKAGVSSSKVLFYERRGLISAHKRLDGGYRFYSDEMLTRLHFIQNAHRLGFTLREIDRLFKKSASPDSNCRGVAQLVSEKVDELAQSIQRQKTSKAFMGRLLGRCGRAEKISECPIVLTLRNPKLFSRRNDDESIG